VFPCKPGGKEPLTRRGFYNATTNPQQITAWWNANPEANIGIPTGERSGLLVLDVDQPAGLDALEAEHGELPATRTHSTGSGGMHYLFKFPPGEKISISAGKLATGVDTRGEGGYIVAPPSRFTRQYEVLDRLPLAAPPEWLLEALRRPQSAAGVPVSAGIGTENGTKRPNKHSRPSTEATGSHLSVSADGPIPDGRRNETLFKYGCALRARGFDQAAILEELENTNERLCTPPLDASEVERIATSASKYEPGNAAPGPDAETLEALDGIEAENLWGRTWKGQGWKTPRSVMVELIREARRHGKPTKAGVRVSISVRNLALSASVGKAALTRNNGALDKLKDAGLIRSVKGYGTKSGAYVLLAPTRARSTHSTTKASSPSSGFTQRAPRLRYNKPVYETVDRVSRRVATVRRLGKNAEEIIDILENAGETMSVTDLAEAKGITRLRDLRNRVLPRLEAAGVVECSEDAVKLRPDWLAALNRKREEDQELEDYERDKKKYAEESRIYALKLEAGKLSSVGMSLEEIAGELKVGMEDVYRLLEIKRPVADFEDGYFEELERVEEVEGFDFEDDPVEDFPEPTKSLLTPLAVAVRDYLERFPRDAHEPAGWIANTLWCYDLYPGKPTRHEVTVALEELNERVAA
jgi:DNA-binding IscR family transcriptional regulator